MYWPKFSYARFPEKLKKSGKKHGVSCTYVKWTTKVGLKLYETRSERDRCVRLQKKAAKARIGPRVGDVFSIVVIECKGAGNGWWGDAPNIRRKVLHCYFTEHATVPRRLSMKKVEALRDALYEIDIDHGDLHEGNTGYLGKRLVCIDFDSASCD
jgi:hypothetical protein